MAGFKIEQSEEFVDVEIYQGSERGVILSLTPNEARKKAKRLVDEADKAEQYKSKNRATLDEEKPDEEVTNAEETTGTCD